MKIAVPVEKKDLDSAVCVSFGRTPYFLFYQTENQNVQFLDNDAANAQGGAGIKAAQSIVDAKADALLTIRCGENAAEVLTGAKIKVYRTQSPTARQNIEAFQKGELSILTEVHAGLHHHGGTL